MEEKVGAQKERRDEAMEGGSDAKELEEGRKMERGKGRDEEGGLGGGEGMEEGKTGGRE